MTSPMRAPTPAHVLVFAASMGMVGVCTGLALEGGANPLTVVTFRTVGVVVLFLAYFQVARVSVAMPAREAAIAIAIGVVLCLNNYTLNAAIGEIPVPLAVLIFYLWPALTTAAAWALGKERFSWRSVCGLALAFAGVGLALNVDFTAAQAHGVWLAVLSAFAWSTVLLLTGHYFHGRDSRPANFWMTSTAAAIFVVAIVVTGALQLPAAPAGWTGLVGLPFFYAFGMIGLVVAITSLGAVKTGFYMNFEPIATVILAAVFLKQYLAPIQLAGAALVIAALFLFRPLRPDPLTATC
jgi:drug/metabolite transporter (DMT)-like permease